MIEFTNISKTFKTKNDEVHALKDISLSVDRGDIFGVIGFSGAGKSTLIRMVNGLEIPTSGSVSVNGKNVSGLKGKDLHNFRKNIGMVFQHFNLLESKTVYQNIAIPMQMEKWPKNRIDERIKELLSFVELDDKALAYPRELSGGQKQRGTVINIIRSVPFIILIVYIMPVTKTIVGTRVGSTAALVPLTAYIAPYLARLIETALLEVDSGIIEAPQAMGANIFQTIVKFVLPESKGSIVLGITTGTVGLLGATAMAGAVGGGGVGDLALTYGYQRFNTPLMTSTVVILVIFVQLIQIIGSHCAKKK